MPVLRSRFAPSPTGDLHLGNARTALLAWLHARSEGGTFIMRIEDLDEGRVREQYLESQLIDLRWLGLDWDEGPDVGGELGPYRQSERHGFYRAAIERLAEQDLHYECHCSRREIAEAASAPHRQQDEGPVYPGTCRRLTGEERESRRRRRRAALRFRVPEESIVFDDLLQGRQRIDPVTALGDFVIRRRDGVPAYQLAVVVDDIAMGITHVLRGADLLVSTARQLLLYRALGASPPEWIHVPLLLGPDGERLSKRHGATSLRELREKGVDPAEVVGWLAATCGLAREDERCTPRELLDAFSLRSIPPHPTRPSRIPWS